MVLQPCGPGFCYDTVSYDGTLEACVAELLALPFMRRLSKSMIAGYRDGNLFIVVHVS